MWSFSALLSKSSEIALQSLEAQKETSARVIELTQNMETMLSLTKEASKVSSELEQILGFVRSFQDGVNAIQDFSESFGRVVDIVYGKF